MWILTAEPVSEVGVQALVGLSSSPITSVPRHCWAVSNANERTLERMPFGKPRLMHTSFLIRGPLIRTVGLIVATMRVIPPCTLALSAVLSLCILATAQKYDVTTTNGMITGHLAPGMRNTVEFLVIPYAQPPLGRLRFAEPLPLNSKTDYVASSWV